MSRVWRSQLVEQMLARAAGEAKQFRPEGLAPEYGLFDGGYHLSDAQAQAILEFHPRAPFTHHHVTQSIDGGDRFRPSILLW